MSFGRRFADHQHIAIRIVAAVRCRLTPVIRVNRKVRVPEARSGV